MNRSLPIIQNRPAKRNRRFRLFVWTGKPEIGAQWITRLTNEPTRRSDRLLDPWDSDPNEPASGRAERSLRRQFFCDGRRRRSFLGRYGFPWRRLFPLFERLQQQINQGALQAPCRSFVEFDYATLQSWSRPRRVIGKAEILPKGNNPRFIVTNLPAEGFKGDARVFSPAPLYENFYCARGDMENRIKEQQLDLFADRTSTHWMASNQLRLWFSAFAHLLVSTLRA